MRQKIALENIKSFEFNILSTKPINENPDIVALEMAKPLSSNEFGLELKFQSEE